MNRNLIDKINIKWKFKSIKIKRKLNQWLKVVLNLNNMNRKSKN